MNATAIVIPARYGSSRLRGKPLMYFHGKTLIEHTYRAAASTGLPVIVATDDDRIKAKCEEIGAAVIMTPAECENGTERCAIVAENMKPGVENIINWQGDSPLIPAQWIPQLVDALERGAAVATPVQLCSPEQSDRIRDEFVRGTVGATCAVMTNDYRALYFSKAPIPFRGPLWIHVGIYAYRRDALMAYGHTQSRFEASECLEQLRFLENGTDILCVPVEGERVWEVNNFSDIAIVEQMMGELEGAPD